MIIIRFSRVGKKGHAQYKVVLAEKSYPIQGKFIEQLGSYDPHKKEAVLKTDRIAYWIGEGAACSDSAHNLFVREGLIKADKRKVSIEVVAKEVVAEPDSDSALAFPLSPFDQ
jgi:small subunit ribosomal protein S16